VPGKTYYIFADKGLEDGSRRTTHTSPWRSAFSWQPQRRAGSIRRIARRTEIPGDGGVHYTLGQV